MKSYVNEKVAVSRARPFDLLDGAFIFTLLCFLPAISINISVNQAALSASLD
jgi:hypothetical protein